MHNTKHINEEAIIGIITVSDRASKGEYEDKGGPAVQAWLDEVLITHWHAEAIIIPDDQAVIEETLINFCDNKRCDLVITTGGTGPAVRDVTPEATESVCEKILPGFGEQMRQVSLQYVPTAILSRQTAGIRGKSLIINLPGQPKAIGETLDGIFPAVPYCIDLIEGAFINTNPYICKVFRPKS
jgi:molybdopterin adenylyltransferase